MKKRSIGVEHERARVRGVKPGTSVAVSPRGGGGKEFINYKKLQL